MQRLILVDGTGLIYRGFYAIPPFFRSPEGKLTNAVFGFTNIILGLLEKYKPDYFAVAFDRKGPTFRHKEYADYKATRTKAPQELYDQIAPSKDVISAFDMPQFEAEGFEADDILATITHNLALNKDLEILVATGDFDLFQLAGGNASVLYPTKGFKDAEILDAKAILDRYGVAPHAIPDYKGLAGDSSDNISGVRGIGDKGAIKLIQQFGSIENIYAHLDEIPGAVHDKLESGKEDAFKCRNLTTLRRDVPVAFELEGCCVKEFSANKARELFLRLGFKSLIRRLDELYKDQSPQPTLL